MAWGASTGTVAAANNKVAGLTYTTGAITCPSGDTIFLVLSFDNTTTTGPGISSITVPGGETATWRRMGGINSLSNTAGAGIRGEVYMLRTTTTWTAFSPVVTFTASITAKSSFGCCKSGGLGAGPRVDVPIAGAQSSTSAPSQANARVQSGDLVLGLGVAATATAMTADADTTNGAWVTEGTSGTTGGTDNTNVTLILQSKIPTATGTQTYNPTDTVSTQSGALCLEFPATATVLRVGRIHAEVLEQPPTPDLRVGRVHIEVLSSEPVGGAALTRIDETDTVFPIDTVAVTELTRIDETDTVFAVDAVSTYALTRITETDTVFAVTAIHSGGVTIRFKDGTPLTLLGFKDGTPLTVTGLADGTPLV